METPRTADMANIGKSVVVKGELSGSEDLYVDGQIEGTIELQGNALTIGPNGQVRANVNAKNLVVHGKLDGNVRVSERTELRKTAMVTGDISSQKIAIEDGAYFKGKVDIQKELPKSTPAAGAKTPQAPSGIKVENTLATSSSTSTPSGEAAPGPTAHSGTTSAAVKTPVTDAKKF